MPAYFIYVRDEISNPKQYAEYGGKAMASFAGHQTKFLAGLGKVIPLEGEAPDGVVVVEFPTVEAARAWYDSPEYRAVVGQRLASASGRAFIVEGMPSAPGS